MNEVKKQSPVEKIATHYKSAISGDMKMYHVKEWDLDIYYRTTYPFKDEARVLELQTAGKSVEALVESLIVKARDKDGKRLFTDADKVSLMHEADPAVLIKACAAINTGATSVTLDEAEKK
jgi:hypothetical protein